MSSFVPVSDRRLPGRRVVLRGAGALAALAAGSLAGCGSLVFPDFAATKPLTETDKDRPYKAVDPARAAAVINAYRAKNGIAPLTIDPRLNDTAAAYARAMGAADKLSHEIGGTLRQRLAAAGYRFGMAGENVGVGYRDFDEVFEGWKRSPAHDRGMKDADMTLMGIGSFHDRKTNWQTFWCLQFARPPGA
jgi:uncharacterized protein YkwD